MKNVRSSFLKRLPGKVSNRKLRTLPKRFGLIAFLTLLIGVPIFIIVTRILPKTSEAGIIFYWVHDHLYLPVKGYTYTLFYPFSISWWGPIATILLVWLIAYLTMVSVTRGFHAHVLRKVVRRNSKHGFLLKTTRWLRKWRFEAFLLKEVSKQEREKSLTRLVAAGLKGQQIESECKRLFQLTMLQINLYTLPRTTETDHLEAILGWHETYKQLLNRMIRSNASPLLNDLIRQLAKFAETLFPLILDYTDDDSLKEAMEVSPGFDKTSIIIDLLHLAALYNSNLTEILKNHYNDEDNQQQKINNDYINTLITGRLAESVTERQEHLDKTRIKVEKIRKKELDVEEFTAKETAKQWPLLLDETDEMPVLCRLALSIGLNLGGLVGSSALALGFMEAIETLDFEMNCVTDEMKKAGLFHPMTLLPESADFRWCAELAEEELIAYEVAWKQSHPGKDSPIKEEDFRLARTRIRALYHASGPNYDNASGGQNPF
jgi:hypothetical protein